MRRIKLSERNETTNRFFIGFLAGSISGAIIALLYAPKSGRKLRKEIGRKSNELIDNTEDYISKAKDKANEIISDNKKKAEQFISDAKNKAESFIKNR
jgi:gas vesicle protein